MVKRNKRIKDFERKYTVYRLVYEINDELKRKECIEELCNQLNLHPSSLRRIWSIRIDDKREEARPSQLQIIKEVLNRFLKRKITLEDLFTPQHQAAA